MEPRVILWGSGRPHRELLYVDDLADACVFLMNLPRNRFDKLGPLAKAGEGREINRCYSIPFALTLINIGTGKDQTIQELAKMVAQLVGFDGVVEWDTSKPDGKPQKMLDGCRLTTLGWKAKISLQ